jgi:hypothetical protein
MWSIFLVFSLFLFYNSCKVLLKNKKIQVYFTITFTNKQNFITKQISDVQQCCVFICDK